ncbi:MAG: PBSX family phage terminase large subunit [Pseudodesulfovibrio sp.]|uniref:PBSX family phage terminase large subunit n=1 Tax=Pseudodesulfovibrio sp. TaxID=2035812 RepID=UPI003D113675
MSGNVQLPQAFSGLFEPHRYKVAYGGRGGAKSRSFARTLLIEAASSHQRVLCGREVQNSIRDSVKRLLDDEIRRLGLSDRFRSTDREIVCPENESLFIFSGLRVAPDRIKSYEGLTRFWGEEAHSISERSLDLIIPTMRAENSELWFSFNPERIQDAVYQRFVINEPPPGSWVKKVGWQDNPWFPQVLRSEMEHCKRTDPDKWDHVWNGNPQLMAKGSYYGKLLQLAEQQGRIGSVPVEPNLLVNTAWDLGMSDSTAIWFFQYLPVSGSNAGEFRVIDYYEASGEGLPHYASVLQQRGYNYGKHIAPHDIRVRELGTGKSRLEVARSLGIRFDIARNIPIQDGIEAARQVLPQAYFDKRRCEQGLQSLWAYQREWDDINNCFKDKPRHDWTSHGADGFRYLAVGFRPPREDGGTVQNCQNYNPLAR